MTKMSLRHKNTLQVKMCTIKFIAAMFQPLILLWPVLEITYRNKLIGLIMGSNNKRIHNLKNKMC